MLANLGFELSRVESIKKSKVLSRLRVKSPELSHESESSQPEKSESSTTLNRTGPDSVGQGWVLGSGH